MKIDKVNIFWYFLVELFSPLQREILVDNTSNTYVSPRAIGIVLLTVYASLYLIIPFFAIYKGWVYIIGCLLFSLGLRWQIQQIVERGHIWIGIHYS